jgi:hypothetical protein
MLKAGGERSRGPVLDLIVVFILGNGVDGGGEPDAAGFGDDLPAQGIGQAIEPAGGDLGEVAGGQFGFDRFQLIGQGTRPGLAGGDELFLQSLELDGALIVNVVLELAAPVDDGGFADVQFRGDTSKAPPLRAELNEPLLCFLIFHSRRRPTGKPAAIT